MAKKKAAAATSEAAPAPAPAELKLTKTQGFVMERWKRSDVQNAPYNPRTISPEARKRLTANLSKYGHMAPITVNRTTKNLVGGHQRLAVTDALEGSKDYLLDVAVVELSLADEKNQNLFLNNQAAQGEWDLELLTGLLKDIDVDYKVAGFSNVDLEVLLDGTEYLDDLPVITKAPPLPGGLEEGLAGLKEIEASADRAKAKAKEIKQVAKDAAIAPPPGATSFPAPPRLHGDEETEGDEDGDEKDERSDDDLKEGSGVAEGSVIDPAAAEEKRIQDLKAAKKKGREKALEENDTETYVVVTFATREEVMAFQTRAGADPELRYLDGSVLVALLDELEERRKAAQAALAAI